MSTISPFISEDRILNKAPITTAKRALEVISQLLEFDSDDFSISSGNILQKMYEREKMGSTVVGNGVSIPRCKIENLTEPRFAIISLQDPIIYENNDNIKVNLFMGCLFPEINNDQGSQLIIDIIEYFKDAELLEKINNSNTNEELYNIFL